MKSALLWLVLITGGVAHAEPRPNIVLFIADDVSAGDFGYYGHPTLRTPHVNALAAGGLRFSNAYLAISSCSPTRTSLRSRPVLTKDVKTNTPKRFEITT